MSTISVATDLPTSGQCEVDLGLIHENPVALRSVNFESTEFKELVSSIVDKGVMNPVVCRHKLGEDNVPYLELIDGLHRFAASKTAQRATIPVNIKEAEDAEVLEMQLIGNVHRIETKPVEYTKQLVRILGFNPTMTLADLASKIGKSFGWINMRMSLTKIADPSIQTLIDGGQICLSNAYALAKLPPNEMAGFVQDALTLPPTEFIPKVDARQKQIREARRKGGQVSEVVFTPVAHARKMNEIKTEAGLIPEKLDEKLAAAKVIVKKYKITDPLVAWETALQWVLNVDADSVVEAKAKFDAKIKEKEESDAKRAAVKAAQAAERLAKQQKEAQKAAAEAKAKVDAAGGLGDFDVDAELARIKAKAAEKKAAAAPAAPSA